MATITGASAIPNLGFAKNKGVAAGNSSISMGMSMNAPRNPSISMGMLVKAPRSPMLCKLSCRSSAISSHNTTFTSRSTSKCHGASLKFDPLSFRGYQANPLAGQTKLNSPTRHKATTIVASAAGSVPYEIRRTQMADKPKWWRRTIACIPYLMPLHFVSLYAEYASKFIPLMNDLEILTDPVTGNQLPMWFSMIYFSAAYFGVVRNKKCPYFFRYHLVMAMLFENAIQIVGTASGWFPYARLWGDPFWTVVAFAFYFAILECMRNALMGKFPDIPFFSLAARAHAR